MTEKNLDFDKVTDRRGTGCLKYDFAEKCGMPKEALPLWVADMDFCISSYIQEAVIKQAEHGIFGYSDIQESYFQAVSGWMKSRHHWNVKREWLVETPGVVFALAMAVKAYTAPGDSVLIQQPVYYPFAEVVRDNDRKVVSNTLVQDKNGRYVMDLEDFEEKIQKEKIKLFLLCSPHNPVGRVWDREELERVGDICLKHHVMVVSDEIHMDFIYEKQHYVFADVKESYREISVICTAPSKTFNIAGLQVSNIFIPNKELRQKFRRQIRAAGYCELNGAGIVACEAAYRDGGQWYEGMIAYIKANIAYIHSFLEERIPEIKAVDTEGTYLVWLDFRCLGLSHEALEDLIVRRAGLWLDGGTMFGSTGEGFQRINAACPRPVLQLAMEKLEKAVGEVRA